jgi:hypothetical protein
VLGRADTHLASLAPSAAVGALLFLVALVDGRFGLGLSLWLAGGTYVTFLGLERPHIDAAAPLVAVLLLLSGELAAWSVDERLRTRADAMLVWRRAAGVGVLAVGGLVLATLVVILGTVPSAHGLLWTIAGAVAAVGAAGTGILLARR